MFTSTLDFAKRARPLTPMRAKRAVRWVIVSAIAVFVTSVALKALVQAFYHDDFPEALLVKVEALPVIFPIHMVTGALALVLLPLALLLRPWPRWHRIAGRIAAGDALVAGVTAFPVAWVEPVTPWSGAGFIAQAAVWLIFLALGIRHIRAGRVDEHRACMLLMTATAFGAVFFRIYLASWTILAEGRHFAAFYSADAWLGWLTPLAATALVVKKRGSIKRAGGWARITR